MGNSEARAERTTVAAKSRDGATRRKAAALLAGGLVLGVGAAVTLAAWNDSEFAKSTFAAGTFVFQGSTDGTGWSDHSTSGGAAALTFTQPVANLSPTDVVYAPYALRLDSSSTTDAALAAVAPAASGTIGDDLAFGAVATSSFGCADAADFTGGSAVPATLEPGDVVNLCLRITAGADLAQGASGEVVWQWDAVSQ